MRATYRSPASIACGIDGQCGDLEGHGLVELLRDMTRDDAMRIKTLLERHLALTGSARAEEILRTWTTSLPKFVKVMPVDYRRALEEMQKAQQPKLAVAGGR